MVWTTPLCTRLGEGHCAVCTAVGPLEPEPVGTQREVELDGRTAVGHVAPGDGGDPAQAVEHGVAVDVQRVRSRHQTALRVEDGEQGRAFLPLLRSVTAEVAQLGLHEVPGHLEVL